MRSGNCWRRWALRPTARPAGRPCRHHGRLERMMQYDAARDPPPASEDRPSEARASGRPGDPASFAEYLDAAKKPVSARLSARQVRLHIRTGKKRYALAYLASRPVGAVGYRVKGRRLTFGPVGVLPRRRKAGVGAALIASGRAPGQSEAVPGNPGRGALGARTPQGVLPETRLPHRGEERADLCREAAGAAGLTRRDAPAGGSCPDRWGRSLVQERPRGSTGAPGA